MTKFALDKAVGVSFGDCQNVIRNLKTGDDLKLVREPENPVDKNAVRIEDARGHKVGYVKRDGWLSKVVNERHIVPKVQVYQVTGGGEGRNLGVVMKVLQESAE